MHSRLVEVTHSDVAVVVSLLHDMQQEVAEVGFDEHIYTQAITQSLAENVAWFLFYDENNVPFGTCYLQSVHNYWRMEKRFYLGGFYIAPSYRGQGRFKEIYAQLAGWVNLHGGIQIYAHIHQDNQKSLDVFNAVGLEPIEYKLCAAMLLGALPK